MIEESASDSADDVQIRCRVRHSQYATNRDFGEPEDMICTMRIFHPTPSSSFQKNRSRSLGSAQANKALHVSSVGGATSINNNHLIQQGPELVLTPIRRHPHHSGSNQMIYGCCSGELEPITLSKRFASFGSANVNNHLTGVGVVGVAGADNQNNNTDKQQQQQQQPQQEQPKSLGTTVTTIPISDIMVVDMYGAGESHRSNITTMSFGYFEFTLESRNGQDILLAFLKASVPEERVMDGQPYGHQQGFAGISSSPSQTSASTRSFDVEAFTASRIAERVESESFSEKLRRRVVKVVSSIEEISSVISECACGGARNPCGGGGGTAAAGQPETTTIPTKETRDSPPRNYGYSQVELSKEHDNDDDNDETTTRRDRKRHARPQNNNNRDGGYTMTNTNSYQRREERNKHCHLPHGLSVEESECETSLCGRE